MTNRERAEILEANLNLARGDVDELERALDAATASRDEDIARLRAMAAKLREAASALVARLGKGDGLAFMSRDAALQDRWKQLRAVLDGGK